MGAPPVAAAAVRVAVARGGVRRAPSREEGRLPVAPRRKRRVARGRAHERVGRPEGPRRRLEERARRAVEGVLAEQARDGLADDGDDDGRRPVEPRPGREERRVRAGRRAGGRRAGPVVAGPAVDARARPHVHVRERGPRGAPEEPVRVPRRRLRYGEEREPTAAPELVPGVLPAARAARVARWSAEERVVLARSDAERRGEDAQHLSLVTFSCAFAARTPSIATRRHRCTESTRGQPITSLTTPIGATRRDLGELTMEHLMEPST